MDKPPKPREHILREMAGIERMEKGRLTPEYREIEREGQTIRRGPYDKHQCWVNGANPSRRVRVEEAEALSEAVDGARVVPPGCNRRERLPHCQGLRDRS